MKRTERNGENHHKSENTSDMKVTTNNNIFRCILVSLSPLLLVGKNLIFELIRLAISHYC